MGRTTKRGTLFMARTTKPLTYTEIEKAKPKKSANGKLADNKLQDGQGLYLLVKANGSKLWRFNYYKSFTKKRSEIALGRYPDLSLAQAREIGENYRTLLAQNIDPLAQRQNEEIARYNELNNTFEVIAWQWFEYRKTRKNFSANYARDIESLIKRHLLPAFGKLPISQITAPMALKAFKPLQDKGTLEALKRSIQKLNEIMTYARYTVK